MTTGWELGRGKGAREEDFVEMGYYPGGGGEMTGWELDRGEEGRRGSPGGGAPGGGGRLDPQGA